MLPSSVLLHIYYIGSISNEKTNKLSGKKLEKVKSFNLLNGSKQKKDFNHKHYHLWINTGTNSINSPVSGVIVIQMYFSISNTWMSLSSPIKKTMVNGHSNTSITNMRRVCSNEHGLVMWWKVTPNKMLEVIKTMIFMFLWKDSNFSERLIPPRNCNICAFSGDIYQAIIIITEATTVYPYVFWLRFYLNGISIRSFTTFKL